MRKIFTFGSMLILALAGELHAAPLDNLTNDQKSALGQLFGGYSESFLCNKQVDFDVAAAFLKSKLGSDTLSVKQAANLAHIAIGIQIIAVSHLENERVQQSGKMQKEAAQNVVKEHCMRVEQAFGPKGNVILVEVLTKLTIVRCGNRVCTFSVSDSTHCGLFTSSISCTSSEHSGPVDGLF